MQDVTALKPGNPAPVSAWYEELNISGDLTGAHAYVSQGDPLPCWPLGARWRESPPPGVAEFPSRAALEGERRRRARLRDA
jgi:hypothetical protein